MRSWLLLMLLSDKLNFESSARYEDDPGPVKGTRRKQKAKEKNHDVQASSQAYLQPYI
jgi:hypothetical protein